MKTPCEHPCNLYKGICKEAIACEEADSCERDCEHKNPHTRDSLTDPCDFVCIYAVQRSKPVECVSITDVEEKPDPDALEYILDQMWEGDTSDLNMIRIAKKEMMYEEVTRWLIAGLNEGYIEDEKNDEEGIIAYNKADLDGWIDKVEEALKKLEEL